MPVHTWSTRGRATGIGSTGSLRIAGTLARVFFSIGVALSGASHTWAQTVMPADARAPQSAQTAAQPQQTAPLLAQRSSSPASSQTGLSSPGLRTSVRPGVGTAETDETDQLLDTLIRPYLNRLESGALPRDPMLEIKSIDLTADPDDVWQRIRQGFAIRNISSPEVPQRMGALLSDPQRLYNQLERAGPYLYYIVGEIERRGMPTELALLPFVESSFNPHSTSRAGAAGLWQFIPSTGKYFKLRQGGGQDERRDVVASTQAALDYLSQLYEMYGDWYLALAAYNWGEGSVRRALESNRRNNLGEDYLSLRMPDETRNYVPKLQAIKNIIDSPAAFGIKLPMIENKPFFVSVTRSKAIDVNTAARLANLPVETFRDLNPGFRSHIAPDPDRSLLVPADRAQEFESALNRYSAQTPTKVGIKPSPATQVASIGLKADPGQINGFAARYPGDTGNDGLQDSVSGFFRPYWLGTSEPKGAPAKAIAPNGTAAKTTGATGGAKPVARGSIGNVNSPTPPNAPKRPQAPTAVRKQP